MLFEEIFTGHDNTIDLRLSADDEVANITNTTRCTVEFKETVVDSDISPAAFNWAEGEGVLHLMFGEEVIPAGSYKAVLTLYDSVNTNGIVWGDFRCRVVAD